jgi:hypothetical protein
MNPFLLHRATDVSQIVEMFGADDLIEHIISTMARLAAVTFLL